MLPMEGFEVLAFGLVFKLSCGEGICWAAAWANVGFAWFGWVVGALLKCSWE